MADRPDVVVPPQQGEEEVEDDDPANPDFEQLGNDPDQVWETLNQEGFEPPAPGAIRIARQSGMRGMDPGAKVLTDVAFHHGVQYTATLQSVCESTDITECLA